MSVSSIGPRALVFGTMQRNPNADSASAAANAGGGATTALNVYREDPELGATSYRKGPKPADTKPDKSKFGPNTMDTEDPDPSNPLR